MRRAIGSGQKQARREAIMLVAWELFQHERYDTITISAIAAGAGLAKGTIYLYFATKEELFFAILEQQFDYWFDAVDRALVALGYPATFAAVAAVIVAPLSERPALRRLFAIMHAVLEQHVAPEAIAVFKAMLERRIGTTGALVERALPHFAAGQGPLLLVRMYALVVGLQQLADSEPVAAQSLDLPSIFTIDFAAELTATLIVLLDGMSG